MGVVQSMEVSKAGGLVVFLAARVGQWWQEVSRNCPSIHSEAATGNLSIFGKRSQIPLLLLTSTHEHCRPAMIMFKLFHYPQANCPTPTPRTVPGAPTSGLCQDPSKGLAWKSLAGVRASLPSVLPRQWVLPGVRLNFPTFLLRELNILSIHPSQVLPGCLVGSKKTWGR